MGQKKTPILVDQIWEGGGGGRAPSTSDADLCVDFST